MVSIELDPKYFQRAKKGLSQDLDLRRRYDLVFSSGVAIDNNQVICRAAYHHHSHSYFSRRRPFRPTLKANLQGAHLGIRIHTPPLNLHSMLPPGIQSSR